MRRRHATYFLSYVEDDRTDLGGSGQRAWFARMEREDDNLRAVLRWSLQDGAIEVGLRLAAQLWRLWYVYGRLSEGRNWLEQLLARAADAPAPILAAALRGAAGLATQQMDFNRAIAWSDWCLALYRLLGDRQGIADILTSRANLARDQEQYAQATQWYDESLTLYRDLNDLQGIAVVLNNRGTAERYQGHLERAGALYAESLSIRRQLDDRRGMAWTLNNMSAVLRAMGDLGQAAACLREALQMAQAGHDRLQIARSLEGLAVLAAGQGSDAQAARLFGAAASLRSMVGSPLAAAEQSPHQRDLDRVRSALDPEAFARAWEQGAALPLDEVVAGALALSV
jgi:non-specific serine/threonine protein kinase